MTVLHRLLLTVFFLIAVSPVFAAGPSEHVRAIVSGIVTYTRWPSLTGAPKLCIFASSRFTHSLAHEDPDALPYQPVGNDSNLLIVFYVQIMPDDFVMQLHRF